MVSWTRIRTVLFGVMLGFTELVDPQEFIAVMRPEELGTDEGTEEGARNIEEYIVREDAEGGIPFMGGAMSFG